MVLIIGRASMKPEVMSLNPGWGQIIHFKVELT